MQWEDEPLHITEISVPKNSSLATWHSPMLPNTMLCEDCAGTAATEAVPGRWSSQETGKNRCADGSGKTNAGFGKDGEGVVANS